MNMKNVTVTDEDSHGHSLFHSRRFHSPRKYKPLSCASRPDSRRIAKKRIIHHCLLQADRIPVALQRNGLYTKQTGFQSHCKETDYTPLSFASRPDSSRIAKKQIIHHCLLKQTGFQSHCKETDYTPFARRLETSTFYHQYINFGSISYINTYLDFSSPSIS